MHELLAGKTAPAANVTDEGVVLTVPDAQLVVAVPGTATVTPVGKVSVKSALNVVVEVGSLLVNVIVRVDEPPTPIMVGLNVLPTVGVSGGAEGRVLKY